MMAEVNGEHLKGETVSELAGSWNRSLSRNCLEHAQEASKVVCKTCKELVCLFCVIKGGKHYDHEYELLNEAFEKCVASLEPGLVGKAATMKKALTQINDRCVEIKSQQAVVAETMRVKFGQLHDDLKTRETELVARLDRITQGKLKGLEAQRNQIETALTGLMKCLPSRPSAAEEDGKARNVQKGDELTTPIQPYFLEPNTEADMVFSASDFECLVYGQVMALGSLDPSRCYARGNGVAIAAVGKKSTAMLYAVNIGGTSCREVIETLKCELESEIYGTTVNCAIERKGSSQYEISYDPIVKGRHQLHIKADGQRIRGSPFSVAVQAPIEELGAPILTTDDVKGPMGVAINQEGEAVVVESSGSCVSVFSRGGEKLLSFSTSDHESSSAHFSRLKIAVDGEGNILLCDYDGSRILKFSSHGDYIASVGTQGRHKALQFQKPADISFNPSNSKIYVIESGNCRVQVLNSDLTSSSTFGKRGSGKGHFTKPLGIACDSTGQVYVTDSNNHRIQVFTAEGKFVRMFGKHGKGPGELNWPLGVAIDANGMVYVSEQENHRVSVFTPEGTFVTSFGEEGKGPGKFSWPIGLAVDSCGVVYVCDRTNNTIQMF